MKSNWMNATGVGRGANSDQAGGVSKVKKSITLLMVLSLILVGCGDATTSQVTLVDPLSAVDLLESGEEVIVLDVRTPEETATGALPGAINIDVSTSNFRSQIAELDRDGTYLVYCRSGNRSRQATDQMLDLGFTNLYELDGGIVAWVESGLELGG